MVHEPIPPKQVRFIPLAREAVEKEWAELEAQKAWDISVVQEMSAVKDRYRKIGKAAHFGRVFHYVTRSTPKRRRSIGNIRVG